MPNLDEVWDNYIKDRGNPEKVKALVINYPNMNKYTVGGKKENDSVLVLYVKTKQEKRMT